MLDFDKYSLESTDQLGENDIIIISPPNPQHNIFLHLFRSSLFFSNVLKIKDCELSIELSISSSVSFGSFVK